MGGNGFRVQGSGVRWRLRREYICGDAQRFAIRESDAPSHSSLIPAFKFRVVYVIYLFKASIAAAASIVTPKGRIDSSMEKLAL